MKIFKKLGFFAAAFAVSCCLALTALAGDFPEKLYDGKALGEYADLDNPDVTAYSAYVYNLESGSVLYQKKANDTVYPASTAKLMTAIVAYENIPDLQTVITAGKTAINASKGSNMAIKIGEKFTAEQLLYGLLVTGANDAANVLAEYVGGTIPHFCEMMNEKAKALGAKNTHYVNPTGLHDPEMITTAKDTAIIARHFYFINTLFEMSDTTRYILAETEQTDRNRILLNRNLLISRVRSEDYYYAKAAGLSMGSTPEAGECLVTTATDDAGLTYLCVVMNAYSEDEDSSPACIDAKSLLDFALNNFAFANVLTDKSVFCGIPVKLAVDTDYVTLLPAEDLKSLLPKNLNYTEDISIEPRVSKDYATAPVFEGDVYGEAVVKYKDGTILGTVNLVAGNDVDKSNVLYILDRARRIILGKWFRVFAVTAIILLLLYFVSSYFYAKRYNHRRRRY